MENEEGNGWIKGRGQGGEDIKCPPNTAKYVDVYVLALCFCFLWNKKQLQCDISIFIYSADFVRTPRTHTHTPRSLPSPLTILTNHLT